MFSPALLAALLVSVPAVGVTRDEIVARAEAWVSDSVPYSWDAWYTDPSSGSCCYRSDCSGLVSAAWGIAPPGNTTYSFAGGPWDDGQSYVIAAAELLPGDALNYPGDPGDGTGHVMLYLSGDFGSGWVEVIEEYSHGHVAEHRWREIDPSIYLPIRYVGVEDCVEETCNGADDDCDGVADDGWVCETPLEPARAAWRGDARPSSDVDGDGRADVCARGTAGFQCWSATDGGWVAGARLSALSDAAGYDTEGVIGGLRLADVDADGRDDVCVRHAVDGFGCWPSTGAGFGERLAGPALTDAAGWGDTANDGTVRMLDVDGDGRSDVCARADAGVLCWLADGAGFPTRIAGPEWSDALGWAAPQYASTIRAADIDGDGRDDLCARGVAGVDCWVSDGAGFPTRVIGPALSNDAGWDDPAFYPSIAMPDIDGDGRDDLCARASAGVRCWRSTGTGFEGTIVGPELSDASGWGDLSYASTQRWADIDGDGRDDLCARSSTDWRCWTSTGTAFSAAVVGPALGNAEGWSDYANFSTIQLADADGDGRADVCARADAGLLCWAADGSGFAADAGVGPEWSDALGWDAAIYAGSLRFAGPAPRPAPADTGDSGDTGTAAEDTADTDDSGAAGAQERPTGEAELRPGGCGCAARGADVGSVVGAFGVAGVLARARRRPRLLGVRVDQ